jgi:K+/H+ antiporter YhaU regulatory subunit KhtT
MLHTTRRRPRNPQGRIPVLTAWYTIDSSNVCGNTIADLDVGKLTGCSILALRREGKYTQFPDFNLPLVKGDEILVAGTNEQLLFFSRTFGLSESGRTANGRKAA